MGGAGPPVAGREERSVPPNLGHHLFGEVLGALLDTLAHLDAGETPDLGARQQRVGQQVGGMRGAANALRADVAPG